MVHRGWFDGWWLLTSDNFMYTEQQSHTQKISMNCWQASVIFSFSRGPSSSSSSNIMEIFRDSRRARSNRAAALLTAKLEPTDCKELRGCVSEEGFSTLRLQPWSTTEEPDVTAVWLIMSFRTKTSGNHKIKLAIVKLLIRYGLGYFHLKTSTNSLTLIFVGFGNWNNLWPSFFGLLFRYSSTDAYRYYIDPNEVCWVGHHIWARRRQRWR